MTRITTDPKVLVGKPVIRGTRLSVEFIIGLLADGWTEQDILDNYPNVVVEDIKACLAEINS
ncbi:MAG TPA: antitoxin [Alphaproteobacteria bacterium]|nr:antitoxin [Alphaproteobacteria bacterium]HAJ45845.1 antitoxin [Alphaproteobacteria bacterium]